MKYERITDDHKRQMLESRLSQYEQEHYNHSVNLALLQASGADDEGTKAAIRAAEEAMATLDTAHANTKSELSKLDE